MGQVVMLVIMLAVPFGLWNLFAGFMGAKSYLPSSLWVYICECASVFLPILFFVILYDIVKKKERKWVVFATALGCLVLFFPSLNYVIRDISLARENEQNFAAWEKSVLASCQSIVANSLPSNGDVKVNERIWTAINGRFDTSERDQLLGLAPEKRSKDVQVIAIIDETYRETGATYVESKPPQADTYIRAVQYSWNVSICDLGTKRVITKKVIDGPEPPATITISGDVVNPDVYGIKPVAEYKTWSESLSSISTPRPSESASIPQTQPTQAGGICWTYELKNFDGNRSQAWDNILDNKTKKLLQYNQFLVDVVLQNPQLKDDGYIFDGRKTYRLPELCP